MNALLPTFAAGLIISAAWLAALAADTASKYYPSPEAAVQALAAAAKDGSDAAVIAALGPDSEPVVGSGDDVADRNVRQRFAARYEEKNEIVKDGDAKAVLQIGKDEWPFPIPLVKDEAGWRCDVAAGEEALLERRRGKNELSAVQVCLAIADAQREYYLSNPEGSMLLHYATRVISDEGKRNGLYWKSAEGEEPSPLGPLVAETHAEGYSHGEPTGEPQPYHGYYYKMLTRQGADAPGGAYDYIAHGEMIGGFAAVAYPAEYDSSGVMTFLVNHDDVVYQKDLGPETPSVVGEMTAFNPDSTWKAVTDTSAE
jgi:hypothetical protein